MGFFQEPLTSKAKVETPSFEPTSTEFETEDLILEVVEDIPAGGEIILDIVDNVPVTGNRKYSKNLKCSRCDVTVQNIERLKRHEEISKGVKNIQTCNGCSFTSCTKMGFKNMSHKCSKSMEKNQSQLDMKILSASNGHTNDSESIPINKELNQLIDFQSFSKPPEISIENSQISIHIEQLPEFVQKVVEDIPAGSEEMVLDIVENVSDGATTTKNCCNKCGKQFSHSYNFEIHMASKDELTNCDLCDFKSCTKKGMGLHMKKCHASKMKPKKPSAGNIMKKRARLFNCNKCDQKFHIRASLIFHEKKIRDEVLSCSKCDFKSCTNMGLAIHLRKVHNITSDNGAMILDVPEQKQSIQMTTHGRFMVAWNIRKNVSINWQPF